MTASRHSFRPRHWRLLARESGQGPVQRQHQVTYPHDPVLVALSASVPRWSDIRRHRDRRRSSFCRSLQRQRGEIHALQPSCSRAWRTGLRQQVRGTQGGIGIKETRPHREVGLGSEMSAVFCWDSRSGRARSLKKSLPRSATWATGFYSDVAQLTSFPHTRQPVSKYGELESKGVCDALEFRCDFHVRVFGNSMRDACAGRG
jgi:hypothetical protein